jgi:hypothetical protein
MKKRRKTVDAENESDVVGLPRPTPIFRSELEKNM